MNYLFFDTETNGLPKNWKAKATDLNNWPRIIQLGFILVDENFEEIDRFCELIRPDGWTIPSVEEFQRRGWDYEKAYKAAKFWLDNGYSTKTNAELGVPIYSALMRLAGCIDESEYIVAHNMAFDEPVIISEMIRNNVRATTKPKRFCTMKSTTVFCGLPGPRGIKWPKLEELHTELFGESFDGAHDALADVSATVRCAKELVRRGVIKFD